MDIDIPSPNSNISSLDLESGKTILNSGASTSSYQSSQGSTGTTTASIVFNAEKVIFLLIKTLPILIFFKQNIIFSEYETIGLLEKYNGRKVNFG